MMKPFKEGDVFDREFKSMDTKMNLTQQEQIKILEKVNNRINRKSSFRWAYMIALTAASLIVLLLALPQISNVGHKMIGSNQIEKNTPEKTIQKYYDSRLKKDYETFYNLQSKRLEEAQRNQTGMTKEDFIKLWKKTFEEKTKILSITVEKGGTEKGTIVSAKVHIDSTIHSPEQIQVQTFKLIKEDGEWKIDEVLSYERIK